MSSVMMKCTVTWSHERTHVTLNLVLRLRLSKVHAQVLCQLLPVFLYFDDPDRLADGVCDREFVVIAGSKGKERFRRSLRHTEILCQLAALDSWTFSITGSIGTGVSAEAESESDVLLWIMRDDPHLCCVCLRHSFFQHR